MALLADNGKFFVCRTLQDVYSDTQTFNVVWYEEVKNSVNVYQVCKDKDKNQEEKASADFCTILSDFLTAKNKGDNNDLIEISDEEIKKVEHQVKMSLEFNVLTVPESAPELPAAEPSSPVVEAAVEKESNVNKEKRRKTKSTKKSADSPEKSSKKQSNGKVKKKEKDKKDKKDKKHKKSKKSKKLLDEKTVEEDKIDGIVPENGGINAENGDEIAVQAKIVSQISNCSSQTEPNSETELVNHDEVMENGSIPENISMNDSLIQEQCLNHVDAGSENQDYSESYFLSTPVSNRNDSKILIFLAKCGDKTTFDACFDKLKFEPRFIVEQSPAIRKDAIHMAIKNHCFDIIPKLLEILKKQPENVSLIGSDFPEMDLVQQINYDNHENYHKRLERYVCFILKNITNKFHLEKCLQIFDRKLFEENIIVALRCGNTSIVEHLFNISDIEYLPQTYRDKYGLSSFHISAMNRDTIQLSTLMNSHPKPLQSPDKDGWLPIHYASANESKFS